MALIFVLAAVIGHFRKPPSEPTAVELSGAAEPQEAPNIDEPIFGEDTERFVAHRGYSGYAPENSIPAFELAGRMGFWGIETDISETSDGAFVCMHDETLDRMTDGEGEIGDYSFEVLEQYSIDSGNYFRTSENLKIPTFEEYLDICREYGCVPVIEIKDIRNYDAFLEVIQNSGLINRCIITGNIDALKEVRSRNSSIPVMTIGYYPASYTEGLSQIAEIQENRGVLYNYPQVEQYVVETLHNQNVLCAVWSIDETDIAEEYLGYGVDFIVTNEIPARLTHMVNMNE